MARSLNAILRGSHLIEGFLMTHRFLFAGAAAAALLMAATSGFAQDGLTGITALNDQIDDINQAAIDDIARAEDAYRFGSPDYRQGLSGSASAGFNGTAGATDSNEFSMGARLRYASGPFLQTVGVAINYAETAGVVTKKDAFGIYDLNYFLNDSLYGFALGRVSTDGLATTAPEVKTDGFLGFGPGYRLINTTTMSWRVQAGVGLSYLEDGLGDSTQEIGYIASSRLFWKLGETMFATNDTDVLYSDTALRVNNDIGLNFKMADMFATRLSYLTEYNDSRAVKSENKLGLSFVYSF